MKRIRLMDRPKDFQALGIDPYHVQTWEDGRRDSGEIGHNEVWYFDAILDDGSKFVVGFRTTAPDKMRVEGDFPDFNIAITSPEGQTKQEFMNFDISECSFSKEKCECRYGSNYVVGDFKSYDIHIENARGLGCHLHYEALLEPFRQGTGIIALGDNEEHYYTDLPVVKNRVTGTLTYDGKTVEVSGHGYHDHQWMNLSPMAAYHHWLWGHLYTENYTVYIYDFVSTEEYGFKHVPLFGVQDNATGKPVFVTNGNLTLETSLETQAVMNKKFPKTSRYVFDNGDGSACEFVAQWKEEIELRNMYGNASPAMKQAYDAMKIRPTYMRYYAHGTMRLTLNGRVIEESGDMIYEYNYMGLEDPAAGV